MALANNIFKTELFQLAGKVLRNEWQLTVYILAFFFFIKFSF